MKSDSIEKMEAFNGHVSTVITAFKDFVETLQTELNSNGVLSVEAAKSLHSMSNGVEALRDICILSALNSGMPGNKIAQAYNLTPGRISQIKRNGIGKKEVKRLYTTNHKVKRDD